MEGEGNSSQVAIPLFDGEAIIYGW